MKEGEYVQHRTRDEWGIGCVMQRSGDRVEVQFDHGLVLLDLKVAGPLFQQIVSPDPEQIAHLGAAARKPARARKPRGKKADKVVKAEPAAE